MVERLVRKVGSIMCELCDQDKEVQKMAIERHKGLARMFGKMERLYNGFSSGKVDPHGNEIQEHKIIAKLLIKELVEWI